MATTIRRIDVTGLFGRYDYVLPSGASTPEMSRLFMLYGDNGSGKTTILRLVFHMLAHVDKAGHKSELAKTPFRRILVELEDGTLVAASRAETRSVAVGGYTLSIQRPGEHTLSVALEVDADGAISGNNDELPHFLEALRALKLGLYFLADDRRLRDASRDRSFDYRVRSENLDFWTESSRRRRERNADQATLVQGAMKKFESWMRTDALRRSRIGEARSDSVYTEVLRRIVGLDDSESEGEVTPIDELSRQVRELGARAEQYSKYGLVSTFNASELVSLISQAPRHNYRAASAVLLPYVQGLSARLNALASAQTIIDGLVSSVNSFFSDKHVRYDVRYGLKVFLGDGEELNPDLLSSGERQMLILLCNCVTLPAKSILIVDEPELSLNVKWQRVLAQALLACTEHSRVQFVLATHSFEILASRRECIVPLEAVSR
jgi:energy-coupling factor transporter ATP-binding protein EcfA2